MIYEVVTGHDCWGRMEEDHESIYIPSWFTKEDEIRFLNDLNKRYKQTFIYKET